MSAGYIRGHSGNFIPVAVLPFKAAIKLELAREDNVEKGRALLVKMCDMMEVLHL
jgi:hypothetical protein